MILHFPKNNKTLHSFLFKFQKYCRIIQSMGLQHLGVLFIPILLYMLWNKYYLNKSEMELLVSSLLMLVVLALDSWVTYVGFLVLVGWHTIVLLNMSRFTYYFDRNKSTHTFSKATELLFKVEEEEIVLILYAVIIWIWIRILSLQSHAYQFNGGTFLTVLNGWNCTLGEFWGINFLWATLCFLSCYSCNFLIKNESDRNNLYKIYLLRYKLAIDQVALIVIFLYNFTAFLEVDDLKLCKIIYDSGAFFRIIWFWSIPISTMIFFFKKHGEFSIESQSQKAEKENNLEEELNRQQIDRQHSKISSKSQIMVQFQENHYDRRRIS